MVCVHAIALRRLPMPTPPPLLRNAPCTQVNGAKTNGSHSNEGEMKRLEEIIVKSLDGTTLYVVLELQPKMATLCFKNISEGRCTTSKMLNFYAEQRLKNMAV